METFDKKLVKKDKLITSQRQYIVQLEQECVYFRSRCLELELFFAENKLKKMPKKAQDPNVYTGDELISAKLVIEDLQNQVALLIPLVEKLTKEKAECSGVQNEGQSPAQRHGQAQAQMPTPPLPVSPVQNSNPNGLRWATSELGPTSMYSQ